MGAKVVVALSDLHFGAFNSVLSFCVDDDAPRLAQLARPEEHLGELRKLGAWSLLDRIGASIDEQIRDRGADPSQADKTLILNGDICDFSLAPTALSFLNARPFFHWVRERGFSRVIYLPGNHDHHAWRMAVEEGPLLESIDGGKGRYSRTADVPFRSEALTRAFRSPVPVEVVYPHYAHSLGADGWQIVFHHGHLLELPWTFLSTFISPDKLRHSLEALEAINEPLTEAVWFALGDAGRLSGIANNLYAKSGSPRDFDRSLRPIIDEVLNGVEQRWNQRFGWLRRLLFRDLLVGVLRRLAGGPAAPGDASRVGEARAARSSLRGRPLDAPLRDAAAAYAAAYVDVPRSFFVFGHTHCTQDSLGLGAEALEVGGEPGMVWNDLAAWSDAAKSPTVVGMAGRILNTGGWVVDPDNKPPSASYFLAVDDHFKLVPVELPPDAIHRARVNSGLKSPAQ